MTSPSPAEVYERILESVDPGLERQVFDVLVANLGVFVTREFLISTIWGVEVPTSDLANSSFDRQIRVCIQRLRDKDFPIVSSSGHPGYGLKADESDIDQTIAELRSKIDSLQNSINHLYRSKKKAHDIRTFRETVQPATQPVLL